MKKQNFLIVLLSVLIIVISVFILNQSVGYEKKFSTISKSSSIDKSTEKSPSINSVEIFENYKVTLPKVLRAEKLDGEVRVYRDNPYSYISISKSGFLDFHTIYYQEDGVTKYLEIRNDGRWKAKASDESDWWYIADSNIGPFIYLAWDYTENSYTYYVLVDNDAIFEVTTDSAELRELVPIIATSIDYLNKRKEVIAKFENDKLNSKSENYYEPTEIPENMPYRDIALKLKSDTSLDVGVDFHGPDEYGNSENTWYLYGIDKKRNWEYGIRESLHYYSDVISFVIYDDVDKFYERFSIENAKRKDSNSYKLPYPAEIKEMTLFGVSWNYFDFEDAYDGGFLREFFRVKDGKVITFILEDYSMEQSGNILNIPKVKYLQNFTF